MDLDKLKMVGVRAMEDAVCANLKRMGLGDKGKGPSPSRDVDTRVACEVMGLTIRGEFAEKPPVRGMFPIKPYSTDMNAAMGVVEKITKTYKEYYCFNLEYDRDSPSSKKWHAVFTPYNNIDEMLISVVANTPAMAMSLAALEVVGKMGNGEADR